MVITGRSKDLIIVNGRNIWPQDIEWAVEAMPGLRRGDVAAFSLDEPGVGERLVLLVQCREQEAERRSALAREVEGLVRRTVAVEPRVVLIPARGLPHTSSGKLSRSRARANYLDGRYGEAPLAAAG